MDSTSMLRTMKKNKAERFLKEIDKAENKIRKQYPFYTDFVEEVAGANLAFKYMLSKAIK